MDKKIVWMLGNRLSIVPGSFRDYYSKVYSVFQFPVDRFNLLPDIEPDSVSTVNIVPEANYNLTNLTNDWRDRYFAICDSMADNIFATVGDRNIVVFYSGGIDSTAALVAIMRHKDYSSYVNANRIKIALNTHSIYEYPDFFYQTILPTLPIVPADFDKLLADPNNFIVTGDGGDYVIGNTDTPIWDHNGTADNLHKPKEIIYPYLNSIEPSGKFSSMLKAIDKKAPFDTVSVNQLYWWLGQCFTHQGEMCYPFAWSSLQDISQLATFDKIYRFFLHSDFMTYGFEHMSTNPAYTRLVDLRNFTKEYIVNHTGHGFYMAKNKMSSQRVTVRPWFKSAIYEDLTHDNNLSKVQS
jgi:hypothetical protein